MLILDLFSLLFVLFIAVKSVSDSKVTLKNMGKFLSVTYRDKGKIFNFFFFFF